MSQIEKIIIRTLCTVQPSLKHYLQIPYQQQVIINQNDINMISQPGTQFKQIGQAHTSINSMCFEVLGFDILIDEKLKPWLIEINHAPSFGTDTCLDFKIKKNLLADTLELLNMSYNKKIIIQRNYRYSIQNRMFNNGKNKLP